MISQTVLVFAESFSEGLSAQAVAGAIGRGLRADPHSGTPSSGGQAGGRLECDVCAIDDSSPGLHEQTDPRQLLDAHDFDRRMRAARALVIVTGRLCDRTLAGSLAFEAATRARQAGVPAYAITARDELDPFEARIVDLQVVLEAGTPRSLAAAGRKLAKLV